MPVKQKRVLVLAPYFVPDPASGTHRTLGLVNHLTKRGWIVSVVTVAESDIEKPDTGLYARMRQEVDILRVPDIDVVQALKHRFKSILRAPSFEHSSKSPGNPIAPPQKNYFHISSRAMRWFWPLYLPDKKVQWALRIAFNKRVREIASQSDVIYSSGPPHSVHLAAFILKLMTNNPWMADLRDPWGGNPLSVIPNNSVRSIYDRFFEKNTLRFADSIVGNTPWISEDIARRFPEFAKKITYVLNGFDTELFCEDGHLDSVDKNRINFVHVGALYGQRDITCLLKALCILKNKYPDVIKDLHFEFVGPGTHDYVGAVKKAQIEKIVSLRGPVPFDEALNKDRNATICMCIGLSGTNNHSQVPAKLYQFIAFGKPVLALAIPQSSIAMILKESGIDYYMADPTDPDDISKCLLRIHNKWKTSTLRYGGYKDKRKRFDRNNMAISIEKILFMITNRESS